VIGMRVFLARHGETEWNIEHRLQGRSDIALTARGRAQALALAERLAHAPLDAIYTSTLRRTIDTAAPLAALHGLIGQPRPELDEMSHGILEGRTASDPDPDVQRLWTERRTHPLGFRAPGGETYTDLVARVAPFVAFVRARHSRSTILIVGHRATNRVVRALLLGPGLENALEFKHKHDRLYEIRPGADPDCLEHRYAPEAQPRSES
jgi:probable phosphoglycerate mutase